LEEGPPQISPISQIELLFSCLPAFQIQKADGLGQKQGWRLSDRWQKDGGQEN
jgi:hypothetical protein